VARKDVNAAHREKFVNAFLNLKEGKDDGVLNILRGKNYVRADDGEYANIRAVATQLKMM
jgi:ABC-type phosphate/phosphonate transport system substrate-binding protein